MAAVLEPSARADWTVAELTADANWVFSLPPEAADELVRAVRRGRVEGRDLLDYNPSDFPLGTATDVLAKAFQEAQTGRGIALVRGLPRAGVSEEEFELLTWAIGLAFGVARPQGRASQYLSKVQDAGGAYRTSTGRGYNTNAELDFHVDGGDLVALTCYNTAKAGGGSRVSSSYRAYEVLKAERPDLLQVLFQPFVFNMQGEEAPGEPPTLSRPIYALKDGQPFCNWNRNRIKAAQGRPEVADLTARQIEAVDYLDEVLRRPEVMYEMYLEPGDMQLLNNHVMLHSRTLFDDYEEPERKRLLFRLWLTPRNAESLPQALADWFPSVEERVVRGGTTGHNYDAVRRDYETRLAAYHGLKPPVSWPVSKAA